MIVFVVALTDPSSPSLEPVFGPVELYALEALCKAGQERFRR